MRLPTVLSRAPKHHEAFTFEISRRGRVGSHGQVALGRKALQDQDSGHPGLQGWACQNSGAAVKPSRMLRVGETLQARCGFLLREVRVRALLERRVSAKELPAYLEEISCLKICDLLPGSR